MEKQVFLDRVRQTLLLNGLSAATVDRQIARLNQYIDEEAGENAEVMLEEEDPVLLAEEICTALRRNAARRSAAEAVTAEMPAVSEPAQAEPEVRQAMPQPEPVQENPQPAPVFQPAFTVSPEVDAARTRELDIVAPSQTFDLVDMPDDRAFDARPAADYREFGLPEDADDGYPAPTPQKGRGKKRRAQPLEIDRMRSHAAEYSDEKAGPLFWVIFLLSLPFAAVIGLAVLALFVVAFAALAALMVAAIAALAVVAAVGTAFVLVALVYGIVQALSVLPVGLYEIGIGITAGAAVLFVSILLYNFAIRLLPFTMKQLGRFFGWTLRSLKMLFIYVKGACAKL